MRSLAQGSLLAYFFPRGTQETSQYNTKYQSCCVGVVRNVVPIVFAVYYLSFSAKFGKEYHCKPGSCDTAGRHAPLFHIHRIPSPIYWPEPTQCCLGPSRPQWYPTIDKFSPSLSSLFSLPFSLSPLSVEQDQHRNTARSRQQCSTTMSINVTRPFAEQGTVHSEPNSPKTRYPNRQLCNACHTEKGR